MAAKRQNQQSAMRAHVGGRVDGTAVLENFEVNMRSGRAPCTAHQSNNVPAANQVADLYKVFLVVRVARTESIAVGNFNHRAITRPMATPTYYATGNGQYVRAIATRKIDARVPRTFTRNRVYAVPVRRGLPSSPNRPPRWCRLGAELLSRQQTCENIELRLSAGKQGIQSTKL